MAKITITVEDEPEGTPDRGVRITSECSEGVCGDGEPTLAQAVAAKMIVEVNKWVNGDMSLVSYDTIDRDGKTERRAPSQPPRRRWKERR